jgi:hypothetical protein
VESVPVIHGVVVIHRERDLTACKQTLRKGWKPGEELILYPEEIERPGTGELQRSA